MTFGSETIFKPGMAARLLTSLHRLQLLHGGVVAEQLVEVDLHQRDARTLDVGRVALDDAAVDVQRDVDVQPAHHHLHHRQRLRRLRLVGVRCRRRREAAFLPASPGVCFGHLNRQRRCGWRPRERERERWLPGVAAGREAVRALIHLDGDLRDVGERIARAIAFELAGLDRLAGTNVTPIVVAALRACSSPKSCGGLSPD